SHTGAMRHFCAVFQLMSLAISLLLMAPVASRAQGNSEQATVTIPTTVSFSVKVGLASTGAPNPFHITLTNIKLSGPTRSVRVSVKANAIALSGPTANAFLATSVSWTASNAVGGVGSPGALNSLTFTPVLTTGKNPGSTSVDLVWS